MYRNYYSGGSTAGTTIEQTSGENDGPSLPVIGAVLVAGYIGVKTLMGDN